MPDTAAVGLLIFDTDGTIVASLRPVYESIKQAFSKKGWPVDFGQADIERYFGTAVGELYQSITPPDCGLTWQQVREVVIGEHEAAFREFGQVFPGINRLKRLLVEIVMYFLNTKGIFKGYLRRFVCFFFGLVQERRIHFAIFIAFTVNRGLKIFRRCFYSPKSPKMSKRMHGFCLCCSAKEFGNLRITVRFRLPGKRQILPVCLAFTCKCLFKIFCYR